ncbi:MAG: hypothetical protein Q9207_004859 [Kuettlingeria erythrocarpa]
MDTKTAIAEYKKLAPEVFRSGIVNNMGGKLIKALSGNPWFKAGPLEEAVQRIVTKYLPTDEQAGAGAKLQHATLLPPTSELRSKAHKMLVCAMQTESNRTVRFRNYLRPGESIARFQTCSIWEAARPISAAPLYFPAAMVNSQKYWDGAIQHNNPVEEVWAEKGDVRPRCVVSLGTGISACKKKKSFLPVIGRVK